MKKVRDGLRKSTWILGAVSLALFVAVPTRATGVDNGDDLAGTCRDYRQGPSTPEALTCAAYIQGFLGGALATDSVVEASVRALYENRSDFMKRAVSSRAPGPSGKLHSNIHAHYCLPVEETLGAVIDGFNAYAATGNTPGSVAAHDYLYSALQQLYPCKG